MLKRLALAVAALLALPASAGTVAPPGRHGHVPPSGNVYAGCTTPGGGTGATWYIDAVNGTTQQQGGNGSQAKPWNSLAAVVGTHTNGIFGPVPGYTQPLLSSVPGGVGGGTGPIHPGDTILLMNGNYGSVGIGDFNMEVANSDWVTVKPYPGQTPVIVGLNITRTNKWIFDGLKIQGMKAVNGGYLIGVSDQGASYPTSDIVLRNLDISSADHTVTTGWTQPQWVANAAIGFITQGSAGNGTNGEPYTTCVSFVNNKVHDVSQGVLLFSNNTLVSGNEISYFGDDGLDYGANNFQIDHNYEHDNFSMNDGNHEDAMQGQNGPLASGVAYNQFSNILIDSNLIIRVTDPNLQFPTYLQGIDAFDEDWTNMTVTNNVIVTSSCYGVFIESMHNGLIADNTVVDDQGIVTQGCSPEVGVGAATHEGPPSTNSRTTNNTAPMINILNTQVGVTGDHNVAQINLPGEVGTRIQMSLDGTTYTALNSPGTYANGNIIDSVGPSGEFTTYSPSTLTYNLLPKAGAPIIGAGTTGSPLPTVDILGAARSQPYVVGAYTTLQ